MTTATTTQDFAARLGLTFRAKEVDSRTDGLMDDMPDGSRHFLCAFENPQTGQGMTVQWSQGPGILDNPSLENVLSALADDSAGFENGAGFEQWASEYGYDTDSRSAEKVYRSVEAQAERLRVLLGDDYDRLLWDVSRDE